MTTDRIFFADNPWPEGHPINVFKWTARVQDGEVWFDFHLQTQNYYAERLIEGEGDEGAEPKSDWQSPGVWGNYHACTLSTNHWGEGGGFPTGLASLSDLNALDGLELVVDDPAPEDLEDNAFGIYLLGHDAAAEHRIEFARVAGTDTFDIDWTGRIALAYTGDYDYRHSFSTTLRGVPAPRVKA